MQLAFFLNLFVRRFTLYPLCHQPKSIMNRDYQIISRLLDVVCAGFHLKVSLPAENCRVTDRFADIDSVKCSIENLVYTVRI